MEKMEKCLKEEVETCVREKLQHYLFEEMKNHFKLMEDNMIKRMKQMVRISKDERPAGVSDSSVAGGKEE